MTYVYQGHIEKIPILEEILAKSGIPPDEIAYVGDDLTDVVVMRRVGLGIADRQRPPRSETRRSLHHHASGGSGAIREVCELLLHARGVWPAILNKYEAI